MLEDSLNTEEEMIDEKSKSKDETGSTTQFPDILQFLPVDEIKKQVDLYAKSEEMINKKGINGYSALHWACIRNDLNLIKYLVNDCKAFVDIKGNLGETPLFICIKYNFFFSLKEF